MQRHGMRRRGFFRYGVLGLCAGGWGILLVQSRMAAELLSLSATDVSDPKIEEMVSRQWAESPEDVAEFGRYYRHRMTPMLPPMAGVPFRHNGGYVVFDPKQFPHKFTAGLVGVKKNGVTLYPITVVEDSDTRESRFFNAKGKAFYSLPPPKDYNPYAWLVQTHPELYADEADPMARAEAEAIWDPARVRVVFDLVSVSSVSQLASVLTTSSTTSSMTFSEMSSSEESLDGGTLRTLSLNMISELAVVGVQPSEAGVTIQIAWPEGFTNRLTIFARDFIGSTGWYPVAEGLETEGTNLLEWTDAEATGQVRRFYRVGNADLDTDGDGVRDAWERLVYGSDPEQEDTDQDGLTDGEEAQLGTDPTKADTDDDGLMDGAEVYGWEAWQVTVGNGSDWREAGATAFWITNWNGGLTEGNYVNGALSDPIAAAFQLGDEEVETFRVGSDGYLLLGQDIPTSLSEGVNLPLPWVGLNRFVAPFWDELWTPSVSGVWVEVTGSGVTERVTVTWLGVGLMSEADAPQGLDVQCDYQASDGSFTFRYRQAEGFVFPTPYALFTIGLQGKNNAHVARFLFNRPGILTPQHRIRIAPALTDPLNPDTDDDGLPDGFEAIWASDPMTPVDPDSDEDGDGLPMRIEILIGSSPWNVDTDGDGLTDAEEWLYGMDPLDPDDSMEDFDQDGLINWREWMYNTDPWNWDTDGDGVSDGEEAAQGSHPGNPYDGGQAPEETVEVFLMMDNGGYSLTDRIPGTVLQLGHIRYRQPPDGGNEYNGFVLPRGEECPLALYSQAGMIQQRPLNVAMTINGEPPSPVEGHEAAAAQGVLIEKPERVLGHHRRTVTVFWVPNPALAVTNVLDPNRVPRYPEIVRGNWRLVPGDAGWEWRPRVTMKARIPLVKRAWHAVWRTFPPWEDWEDVFYGMAYHSKIVAKIVKFLFPFPKEVVVNLYRLIIQGDPSAPRNAEMQFTAEVTPRPKGFFSWSASPPSLPLTYEGSNATLQLNSSARLFCHYYALTNTQTPIISKMREINVEGHECQVGAFDLQVPSWLMANWNDNNSNNVPDYKENPIPAGDPDAKLVTIRWTDTNMLDCCHYFAPNPRVSIRLTDYGWLNYSNPQVWVWNTNLTDGYTLPTNVSAYDGPWAFALECCVLHPKAGGEVILEVEARGDPVEGQVLTLSRSFSITLTGAEIYEPLGDPRLSVAATNLFILDGIDGPCRYDWQGVDASALGMTAIRPVSGGVFPYERGLYWMISEGCGSFQYPNEEVPWHVSEALPSPPPYRDGLLQLTGWWGTSRVAVAERGIRIYDDHLRRDMANFTPDYLSPFHCWHGVMAGSTGALHFTAFDAARHAYDGKRWLANDEPFWIAWSNALSVVVTNAGYSVPEWGTLARGDVIVYRRGTTNIHVQTCTGAGDETWGADNAPRLWNAQQQMYTNQFGLFTTAPAGVHYQQACPDLFPIEIQLFKTPTPGE